MICTSTTKAKDVDEQIRLTGKVSLAMIPAGGKILGWGQSAEGDLTITYDDGGPPTTFSVGVSTLANSFVDQIKMPQAELNKRQSEMMRAMAYGTSLPRKAYKPPTGWLWVKHKLANYLDRLSRAWQVLRYDLEIEDND